jgi:hypothetical protein
MSLSSFFLNKQIKLQKIHEVLQEESEVLCLPFVAIFLFLSNGTRTCIVRPDAIKAMSVLNKK